MMGIIGSMAKRTAKSDGLQTARQSKPKVSRQYLDSPRPLSSCKMSSIEIDNE